MAASTGTASLDGGEAIGIDEAITAWKANGGVLKLESDCEYESTSALSLSKIQTLDLNGLSLTFKTSVADAIKVASAGSLTIIDGSDGKTGSLSSVSTSSSQTDIIWALSGSTLAIEAGTFSVTNTNGKTVYALYLNSGTTGSISISGGVFENDNKTFTANVGIISGGKFAVQPAYYTPVEGKIYELVDGYYQLTDGTYFASVDNVGYSTIEDFNNALSSDPTKYSTVAVFENKDITIPAGKYAVLTQATSGQENGTFTNNGDVKFSASQTWVSGTVINNGTMAISSGTWKGTAITNSENKALTISAATWEDAQITNDGDLTVSGGTWNDAALTNNGTASLAGGKFKTALYDNLLAAGASLADGCTAYAYYSDVTYKQVLADTDVVATVSEGDNVKAFTSISTAITYSSKDHPAVVAKDCSFYVSVNSTGAQRYLNLNGYTLTQTSSSYVRKGSLTIEGEGTINYTGSDVAFWVIGSNNATAENYSVLNIGEGVTYNALNGYGICSDQYSSSKSSYGVVVNIAGTVNSKYFAIYVNGNVQALTGSVPVYNVAKTAKLTSTPSIAMYAAGYAIWNIEGELSGDTPIYVKAGTVNLNGAKVTATGAKVDPVPNGNGANNTGDAIILDSKKGYAGTIVLNVTGEAELISENGYALHEALTDLNKTATIGLAIDNGAFVGGAGAVELSPAFAAALEDGSQGEQWTLNAVVGGRYSTMPEVVGDGYEVVVTSDATFPYTVRQKQDTPFAEESIRIISEDTTEDNDYTVESGHELIVKKGATLKINGKLTIGGSFEYPAKVLVEAGGTLIVGEGGIELNCSNIYEDALVLKADKEDGTGSLLFNGTTDNQSPIATVELYLHGRTYDEANDIRKWQHFGLPVEGNRNAAIEKTMAVWYNNWNLRSGWTVVNGEVVKADGAWVGHNTTTNAMAEGGLFKFKGNLVGNVNAEYALSTHGYFCYANSYTAPISITNLVTSIFDNDQTDGTLWVYDASLGKQEFKVYTLGEVEEMTVDKGIPSMQAFFIRNQTGVATSIPVNYVSDVYNFTPVEGALRDAAADVNGGKITISDELQAATLTIREGEKYSATYDKRYDAPQMETGMIQIYALKDGYKLATMSTNNFEGMEIEIVTKASTSYTLTFSELKGNGFKLTDMVSGAEIEVSEGGTYMFTADANSTIKRFKLSKGAVSANEAEANSAVNIWAADGNVYVANNEAAADIEIYNLGGVKVASAAANGEALQAVVISGLANGVYIVRVGEASAKVVK